MLKCGDCNRLFANADLAALHAAKTDHGEFSEVNNDGGEGASGSVGMSAEEREKRMVELRAKLAQRRAEEDLRKEAEERRREIERRKSGQAVAELRREAKEREMVKAAEELRRDREEERQIRARIRAEIEEERRLRREKSQVGMEEGKTPPTANIPISTIAPTFADPNSATARLQVKLSDGQVLRETFPADQTLAVLLDRISQNTPITSQSRLVIPFPHRVLDLETSSDKTFSELGLTPSASLLLQ